MPKSAVSEQRKENRVTCPELINVRLQSGESSEELTATLEDISRSGACLLAGTEFAAGTRIQLEWQNCPYLTAAECEPCGLEGEVRHCTYTDFGYLVGIRFLRGCRWVQPPEPGS